MQEYIPSEFYLGQSNPNPFNQKTTIKYCIAYKTRVQIIIYDKDGNEIEKIVDEVKEAGTYKEVFQSVTEARNLASGIYRFRLLAGYFSDEKTMVLEK